jgi:hypothetical protein
MSMRVKKKLYKFTDIFSKEENFVEALDIEEALTCHLDSLKYPLHEVSYKIEEVK